MYTKKEIEYLNSTPIWKNTIEFVIESETDYRDAYVIYQKRGAKTYLAIPIDLYFNNDLLKDVENKTLQELHNNRIKN